jgi:D-hexose-6-phosphate mutarotase
LNKLPFELPKNDYEIIFTNETEISKDTYSLVLMLSSCEFKLNEIFCNYEKESGYESSLHTYFEINFNSKNIKINNILFEELLAILNETEHDLKQFSNFKLILN